MAPTTAPQPTATGLSRPPALRHVAGSGRRPPSRLLGSLLGSLLGLLLPLLTLVLVGQVAAAGSASAHDYLVATSPAADGTADAAPRRVTLTFNEAVNTRFSTVRVTGPSGGVWQDGAPEVVGATVTQRLLPLGPAGPYEVTWRVVSADGHPIGGSFSFTVRTGGTGTPAATDSASGAAVGADQGSGGSWVPLAAGLVVITLLLAGAAAALARRGGRTADAGGRDG
jgi:copper resistance protein C